MAPGKRNARKKAGSSNNQVNKAGSSNSSSTNKAVSSENKDTESNPAMQDAQLAQASQDPLDLKAEAQEFVNNVIHMYTGAIGRSSEADYAETYRWMIQCFSKFLTVEDMALYLVVSDGHRFTIDGVVTLYLEALSKFPGGQAYTQYAQLQANHYLKDTNLSQKYQSIKDEAIAIYRQKIHAKEQQEEEPTTSVAKELSQQDQSIKDQALAISGQKDQSISDALNEVSKALAGQSRRLQQISDKFTNSEENLKVFMANNLTKGLDKLERSLKNRITSQVNEIISRECQKLEEVFRAAQISSELCSQSSAFKVVRKQRTMVISVNNLELESNVAIVGSELKPKLSLSVPTTNGDIPESDPIDGQYLSYKWYRVVPNNNGIRCRVHPSEPGKIQCLRCSKFKSLVARSYHCSEKCFQDGWEYHRTVHENSLSFGKDEEIDPYGTAYTPPQAELQFVVGQCRTYTPTTQDVGFFLELECAVTSAATKEVLGDVRTISTTPVVQLPKPIPRRLIPVSEADGTSETSVSFTVLTYNILSETSASTSLYGYCNPSTRSWTYRRQILIPEILGYGADVVCLQDVQVGHFEDFLAPELKKHGYECCYMKRAKVVLSGNPRTIDGCATFFKQDKFSLVKKYEVDYNKSAQTLIDASNNKPFASERLIKDNIVLITVLQAKFGDPYGKLICVANTRLEVPKDLKDVMLWQVHTLLKGVEKIASCSKYSVPLIMCGDFNMVPGSAPHSLVVRGRIDPSHQDLEVDPLGILKTLELNHPLSLVSAYSAFSRLPRDPRCDKYRTSVDSSSNEPLFTISTEAFRGCHDYIFYTANTLRVGGLMELVEENNALPSPQWPSSHIALLAKFGLVGTAVQGRQK